MFNPSDERVNGTIILFSHLLIPLGAMKVIAQAGTRHLRMGLRGKSQGIWLGSHLTCAIFYYLTHRA